ncbi:MAG TPA: hypothetical protein DIT04_06240 [Dysgonomonas sp.]|nr:hypothetical protein [Dysgonomonas sp.]
MKTRITYILLLLVLVIPIHAQIIRTVNVTSPGSLATLLGGEKTTVTDLTLTGTINAADFNTINQMTALKKMDMSSVNVDNGTFPHYLLNGKSYDRFILPNTLKVLGINAFWYCTINEGLTLPSGLQTIYQGAFAGLTTPFIDFSACQNLENMGYYSFAYTNIGNGKIDLSPCTKLTTFTSLTNRNEGVFCLFSAKVTLPPNMTNLGDCTFANFNGSVEFAEGLKIIGTNTFHGATITEKIVLPNTLEEIGNNAFTNSKLNGGIILPISLKRIREGAFIRTTTPFIDFSACRTLEDIYYFAFAYTNIGDNKIDLSNCSSLTKCTPQVSLNEGAFTWYAGDVILPLNMQAIPPYTFARFQGSVKLPSGLRTIGDYAFNQSNIQDIEFPIGVSSIGANAFSGCSRLSEITSRNTNVPQLGTNAFNGVNTNTCELVVPAQSLSSYKSATGWKDFLKINPIVTGNPDGYVKGKKGSIFVRINANQFSGRDLMGYDYDNNRELGLGQPNYKTYNTIEIGESVWTTQNIRFKAGWNTWLNLNQQVIDQELGEHTIPWNDFEEKFGSLISSMNKLEAYRYNYNVYNQRDGIELQGWDMPSILDFAQLLGMAPAVSDDPIKNIMTFLGVPQEEVPGKTGNEWYGYKNTSGFTMTPAGRRHELEYPNAQYPKLWYSYGRESAFKIKDYPLGMIVFSEIDDAPIRIQEHLRHMCQARYTRNKTDEELGYRLFVDLEKDQVLVKPLSQRCSENLRELAGGLTRGVAVRYMNKQEGIVTKSWSEIQQEAEQIRVRIKLLRSQGYNPRQIDLPATDPFRECTIDQPDEYEKGKEGSIFVRINAAAESGRDLMGYDYDNDRQLGERQPTYKTYKTIEIGEHVWTTENTRFKAAYNTWLNHSQQAVDQELGVHTIPLNDFEKKFGSFITHMTRLNAYRENFNVYDQRDGAEQQGWDIPTTLDFAQLMGIAPQISDDPVKNIMTFLGVPQSDVPAVTGDHWSGYKNTSGFTMTPLGRRHALEYPTAQYPKLWYNYGRESGFKLKDGIISMIVFSEADNAPIRVHEALTHMCQSRYTRNKTDEELGYRLFVDLEKDEVLVTGLDHKCSENLRELANGLPRGVAVRYMKKDEGIVMKSWSEIQEEAEQIRTRIMFLQANGTQIPLPATDPFRQCTVEIPVTGVALNKTSLNLEAGKSETLIATVIPENATNKNVTWSSSDESVANVDPSGKVTAVSKGTATITITTQDGNKTAQCKMIVNKQDGGNPGGEEPEPEPEDGEYTIEFVYDLSGNRIERKLIIMEARTAEKAIQKEIFTDKVADHSIKIYPNPTEGQLSIEISGTPDSNSGNLSIYNMRGQLVTKRSISQFRTDLDISSQPSGTYIFHININGEISTWKIIKK